MEYKNKLCKFTYGMRPKPKDERKNVGYPAPAVLVGVSYMVRTFSGAASPVRLGGSK